ncbi:MAG: hypothetical protein KatS3mg129_0609 [Leptospiraceae bacterium]|nr:MAG: hypothetical protein KatS3mg129_0609 [Leptospiraceae bacterium]
MLDIIKNKLKSITGLLIITVLLTSLIPAILNYAFDFYLIYKESINTANEEVVLYAENSLIHINEYFEQSKNVLEIVVKTQDWDNLKEIENYISKIQNIYWNKLFHHIMILNENGTVIISPIHNNISHKNEKINIENLNFKNNEYIITEFHFFKESNHFHPLMIFKIPQKNYYLAAEIELDAFRKIMNNEILTTYILDQNLNGFGIENNELQIIKNISQHGIYQDIKNLKPEQFFCNFYHNHYGVYVYSCALKSQEFPYTLITEIPAEKIFHLMKIQIIRTTIVFFSFRSYHYLYII